MREETRVQLRHTDRLVGLLVLLGVALFLGALVQRGALREWFFPSATLTVLLPPTGVAGLSSGSQAEVLGINAGSVRRLLVEPDQRIRAELRIEEQAKVFIREDSEAVIRRRFGVAGPAYLDISRGEGPPLNWERAVIEADSERAAAETIGVLMEEIQRRIKPVFDDLERGMRGFAAVAERLGRGEGSVGRLMVDDTLAREAEEAARRMSTMLEPMQDAMRDVQRLTATLAGEQNGRGAASAGSVPALLARADRTMASLERVSRDLSRATPALPRAARNVGEGTDALPAVVMQAQETARQLELLLTQLRGHWLVRGGTTPPDSIPPRSAARPGAERVRP
jgi:phospholipid/cholesterol/gamma-HCH transport system substrate-binding protein